MDKLSRAFADTHLRGSLMATLDLAAPWSIDFEQGVGIPVHWIVEGGGWLGIGDGSAQPVKAGDVLMFPRWHRHTLSSAPAPAGTITISELVRRNRREPWRQGEWSEAPVTLVIDGAGRRTVLLSLLVELDRSAGDLLMLGLPDLVRVAADDVEVTAWLRPVLDFLGAEERLRRPGYAVVQSRLAELLVMQLVRATLLLGQAAADPALRVRLDPTIERAANAMRETPGEDWTVKTLARLAGLSRSTFAARFSAQVGETPFGYLRALRLDAASARLKAGDPVKAVLQDSGYQTGFSFTKAFRARFGVTPGAYARSHRAGDAD